MEYERSAVESMVNGFTILITGGTGFLGSHLANRLSNENEIIILKRSYSDTWRIDCNENIKFYNIDKLGLETIFKDNKIDIVIHTATKYGRNNETIEELVESNYMFPIKILDNSLKTYVKTFINVDTVLPKFVNIYSLTKNHFTDWLKYYSSNMKIFNLKLEHMYGEKDSTTKFIPYIITSLLEEKNQLDLTQGEQERNFIYIADVAEAFKKIILQQSNYKNGLYEYEIGSEENIKIKDLVYKIKAIVGNTTTKLNFGAKSYRENELMKSRSNIEKFKKDFNWKPKVKLDEGLAKTIEWYRKRLGEKKGV